MLVRLDTRQEQAQLAAAEAQRELVAAQPRADAASSRTRRWRRRPSSTASTAEFKQAEARRRRDPRHDRPQDDPGAVRGRARHPPGQPRPVPERRRPGRAAPVAGSDLRQLLGAAARQSQLAAVGAEVQVSAEGVAVTAADRARSRRSTRSSTRPRATCRSRRPSPIRRASCAPACSSTCRSCSAPASR